MSRTKKTAVDKFDLITDKLITLMESGNCVWQKPWHSTPYGNLITGHHYQGINPLLCAVDKMLYDWDFPFFVGFAQAAEKNWKIRKGSKSTWLLWGGTVAKETTDEQTGESKTEFYNAWKWLNVFNVACIDDSTAEEKIDPYVTRLSIKGTNQLSRVEACETFVKAQNAQVNFGGDVACYSPQFDKIQIPSFEDFTSAEAYYATYSHELSHWTGHPSRLDRNLSGKFGSQSYAFEELIAELSSAFVCNELGITNQIENHASYLNNWLQILKSDNKAFFKASSLAQKAAKYLLINAGMKADET